MKINEKIWREQGDKGRDGDGSVLSTTGGEGFSTALEGRTIEKYTSWKIGVRRISSMLRLITVPVWKS